MNRSRVRALTEYDIVLGPLSIGLALIALLLWGGNPTDFQYLGLFVLSTTALLLPVMTQRYHNRGFPDPLSIIAILHFLYFSARVLILRFAPDLTGFAMDSEASFASEGDSVLVFITIAGCAMYWGTLVPQPQRQVRKLAIRLSRQGLQPKHVKSWMIMGVIGACCRLAIMVFPSIWQLGSSWGIIFFLVLDAGLAASVAAFTFSDGTGKRGLAPACVLAYNLFAVYVYGFKEPLMVSLVFLLAGQVARGRRPPWLKLVGAGAVVFFLIFPFVEGRREADRVGEKFDGEFFVNYATGGQDLGAAVPHAVGKAMFRFHGADSFAVVLAKCPSMVAHPGFGEISNRLAISFIPKFFWPDKPDIHQGYAFNYLFYGRVSSEASMAFFQVVEGYYIAGMVGIIIVGAFLGWVTSLVGNLRSSIDSPLFFPYFCIMVRSLMNTERDIVLLWTTLPRALVVFWVLHWVFQQIVEGRVRVNPPVILESQRT